MGQTNKSKYTSEKLHLVKTIYLMLWDWLLALFLHMYISLWSQCGHNTGIPPLLCTEGTSGPSYNTNICILHTIKTCKCFLLHPRCKALHCFRFRRTALQVFPFQWCFCFNKRLCDHVVSKNVMKCMKLCSGTHSWTCSEASIAERVD